MPTAGTLRLDSFRSTRDKDVLLIANAESVQLQKLLTLVRGFSGIAYDLQRHRL